MFIVRTIRNTEIHCVGRIQSSGIYIKAGGIYSYLWNSMGQSVTHAGPCAERQ
jgi:hypothetical protein